MMPDVTECGRNRRGYLLCRPARRCGDCPLHAPVSDQERQAVIERDAVEPEPDR